MDDFYRFQFDHDEMFNAVDDTGFYGLDASFGMFRLNQYGLDHGINAVTIDGNFNRRVEMYSSDGFSPRELKIFVSLGDCCECYMQSIGQRILLSPNKVIIYFAEDVSGYTRAQAASFKGVSVNVSLESVQSLIENYQCKALERLLSPAFLNIPRSFFHVVESTEEMTAIAHQMMFCSSERLSDTLKYRDLGWQLISLALEALIPKPRCSGRMSRADISKIHRAREILFDRMESPPSLIELAREVGLNDFKLKQGFKEVFNQTAFGCLHRQRMEKARTILLEQRGQIITAASEVGYQNHGHFSVAFRKYFGITPSAYLKLTQ